MSKIAFVIFIFIFILLRPYIFQGSGFWYYGDDQDYFAHASSIVFGQFPSYKKEYLTIDKNYPQSSIGSAVLSLPFVWSFSLIDRFNNADIVSHRSSENTTGSWTQFGFIFASCFYFCAACFLLYRGVLYCVEERYAYLSLVLTVLCQGLPLFAFRRPIFSHAGEFFLQSVFIFLLLRNSTSTKKFPQGLWQYVLVGTLAALVYLTRYNNIGFALIFPCLLLLSSGFYVRSTKNWLSLFLLMISFVAMIGVFKIWPEIFNQAHPYPWVKDHLLIKITAYDAIHRLGHIFFGLDWGLVYTAPYILIGSIGLFIFKYPAQKYFKWLFFVLGLDFYIVMIWGSQGGWYGYRYFIASAIPLLVLPVALFFKHMEEALGQRLTLWWALIAIPPVLSMICFEGNAGNLELYRSVQDFGVGDITNNLYQFHVWEIALFKPQQFIDIISKGGVEYVHFLSVHILQKAGLLINQYFMLYSAFDGAVLLKTLMIYALPFVMAGFCCRLSKVDQR
jgi:hypothetical protein